MSTDDQPDVREPASNYRQKHELLLVKYQRIYNMNDRMRNRIYHIKKEIKYLKRLKRILIQRLVHNGDRFVEPCLEIPDSEPGANVEDQIIHDVAQLASHSGAHTHHHPLPTHHHSHIHHHSALVSPKLQQQQQASPTPPMASKKRMPIISKAESRRRSEALYKSLSDDAKASVADIINEVITESRAARQKCEGSVGSGESSAQPQSSSSAVVDSVFSSVMRGEGCGATCDEDIKPAEASDEPNPGDDDDIHFEDFQEPSSTEEHHGDDMKMEE